MITTVSPPNAPVFFKAAYDVTPAQSLQEVSVSDYGLFAFKVHSGIQPTLVQQLLNRDHPEWGSHNRQG
jgi:hypothetical protein